MKQILFISRLALAALFLLPASTPVFAQYEAQKVQALSFLQSHTEDLNLTAADVRDVLVTDAYQSKHNGLTHVWIIQRHSGIPVFNGLVGLHVAKDGKVWHTGHRFLSNLETRVNTNLPSISAIQALKRALADLKLDKLPMPDVKQKLDDRHFEFMGGSVARTTIPVSACYEPLADGRCRLAWQVQLDLLKSNDIWNIRIDALTGEVIGKFNTTVYCNIQHKGNESGGHSHDYACFDAPEVNTTLNHINKELAGDGSKYRVIALPAESPAHGAHTLVTDPADQEASPFGWHDTNGADGAEYNHTRGNNVYAYEDSDSDDMPPAALTPSGGPVGSPLVFDFPLNPNVEPVENYESAITNLFYMNNMMHDIFYRYGFDEPSGNFQQNTYGNGGQGNDAVRAEGLDGEGTDNANFATPNDGQPGRMQMFIWSRQTGKVVKVNSPGAIIGDYDGGLTNNWGAALTATGVTAQAVFVEDGSSEPTLGCEPNNPQDLAGKIAMVDRGICQFGEKALNAQNAGAIGCIICNFEDALINMAAGTAGGQVTIPVVSMSKPNCDLLRSYVEAGLNLTLALPSISGPDFYDANFDNGVIAHEYMHGISNRLTGGPSNSGCLQNDEQMGEGWSDFASLVIGTKATDTPEQRRGVGTYLSRQNPNGKGIRRYPYSTDMAVNPLTFASVAENTEVHALGEVWTAVTWDMYWAFVDKYGFDADYTNTNSGNGRAIQLVMDGMKMQPCNPGFIDGRNAILMADVINYNGEDTCLIQSVFARRGFGYQANQGASTNAADGMTSFDPQPLCIKELKIAKSATPTILPGGEATVRIIVTNHKDTPVTNVKVTDPISAGMSYVPGSASGNGTLQGNQIVWNLGNMPFGKTDTLTYKLKNDPSYRSVLNYVEPMDNEDNWISLAIAGTDIFFFPQSNDKVTGSNAFYGNTPVGQNNAVLYNLEEINVIGARPTLRFWNKYVTEAGSDGGWIEISANQGVSWQRLTTDKSYRNGYTGRIPYGTIAIPFLDGFSGNSNGWIQSYFDLRDYAGQTIQVRYRLATDAELSVDGWYLDQTELIDLVNYNETATITSAEGDQASAIAPNSGIIVDTDGSVSSNEPEQDVQVDVYPNPASDLLMVAFGKSLKGETQAKLFAADGRMVFAKSLREISAGQVVQLDVMQVPPGAYMLQLLNGSETISVKVMIQ